MHVDVAPRRTTVAPGMASELLVTVTNTSDVIGGYSLRALGVDREWAHFDEPEPRLFPGESTTVRLSLRLPERSPAGDRSVSVQATDLNDPSRVVVEEAVLEVPPAPRTTVSLEPPTLTAGRVGTFTATVSNEGNTVQLLALDAVDPEARTTFAFEPPEVRLAPGASMAVDLTATARRPLIGDAALRPFTVRASGPQIVAEATAPACAGMFVQRPVISRGLLGLMGLLFAITLFATVITLALSSVVQQSAADRDLALVVAQARDQTATTGSGSIGGTVLELLTGTPAAGVSVELFTADDTSSPIAPAATDEDGTFMLASLPAGEYLLLVRGAGFAAVWYPSAATPADAAPVVLEEGQHVEDLVVMVGGVPATVSGSVVGGDVGGATVRVELPMDAAPLQGQVDPVAGEAPAGSGGGALLRTVPVSEDGTFEITDLPSPAVYDLVVGKPGFATSTQRLDFAAGEVREGVELALLVGDGSIAGTVSGPEGPLGGASIVATSGQTRVETVSVTQDGVGGFVLRGLPTPGSYTVVVTADGYAGTTMTLTLTPAQELTGVSAVLGQDRGTLAGTVTVSGSEASGVMVTVSDGATTLQTVTRSTDPVGTWSLSGLELPGDYTITFSRSDLESQVLSVSVDRFGAVTAGAPSAAAVDVAMRSATATLTGRVTQTRNDGAAAQRVGNVVVTVSSGTVHRVVTTASTPSGDVGSYVVEKLPPGTYTVTFARSGTRTTSEIIVLSAAQQRTLDILLVAPARIHGLVTQGGDPLAGRIVRLYRASDYGTAAAPVAQTETDAVGEYQIDDVEAPEHYVVEIRSPGGSVLGASAPFTLQASEDREVGVAVDDDATGSGP